MKCRISKQTPNIGTAVSDFREFFLNDGYGCLDSEKNFKLLSWPTGSVAYVQSIAAVIETTLVWLKEKTAEMVDMSFVLKPVNPESQESARKTASVIVATQTLIIVCAAAYLFKNFNLVTNVLEHVTIKAVVGRLRNDSSLEMLTSENMLGTGTYKPHRSGAALICTKGFSCRYSRPDRFIGYAWDRLWGMLQQGV